MFKSRHRPPNPRPRRGRLNALAWPLPLLVATTAFTQCGGPTPPPAGSGGQASGGQAGGGEAGGGHAGAGGGPVGGAAGSDGAAMIGPAGGTVTQAGGQITVSLSPGAVAQPIAVRAVPTSAPHAVPGTAFDLSPEGTLFATPASLTIAYDPAALPPGTDESRLRLATVTPRGLELSMANTVVDTTRHTVRGRIPHFSSWFVSTPPADGDLTVTIISDTEMRVTDTTSTGVMRAYVPVCPGGGTSCSDAEMRTGCSDADFSLDPAVIPPDTVLTCRPVENEDCSSPPPEPFSDFVFAPGFYCYRAGTETVELYSDGMATPPAPAPITVAAAVNPGDGSIYFEWECRPNPTFAAQDLLFGTVEGGPTSWSLGNSCPDAFVENPDPELVGSVVEYAFFAQNLAGEYAAPATVPVKIVAPLGGVPSAPGMATSQATPTSITITWESVVGATGYQLQRAGGTSWSIAGGSETDDHIITDGGLTPGRTYTYTLRAGNQVGYGPATLFRFRTRNADGS